MFGLRFNPLGLALGVALGASASGALAATCEGSCGVLGADGVVTAPPGATEYRYITTFGGLDGVGQLPGAVGTNGSLYTSSVFTAADGDQLQFYFDYITSDGADYADYAFVQLQTALGATVATLFTARTEPTGTIVPGVDLPGVEASLTPASVEIIPGAPDWSPLGDWNNTCYDAGCGYTGWIKSDYTIATGGDYRLVFGVTNFRDTVWDSGLAWAGLQIADTPIDDDYENEDGKGGFGAVPEPSTWALMIAGFGLAGQALRRRRAQPAR